MRDSLTYLPAMDEDIRWTAEGSGLGLRSHFHLQLSIVRQECLKDLKDHELKSPRLRFDYLTLEFDEVNFRSSNTSSGVVCSRHGNGLKHGKGPCFLRPLNERWKYKVKHSHVYMSTYDMCRDIHILYAYILDQHKSNSNTKGLRREIAFELLAVRNLLISQFPQGFFSCPVWFSLFSVVMSRYWNCLSWYPCRFDCLNFSSRTRFPGEGAWTQKQVHPECR